MCGIVGAVSSHNIVPVLVQGLARLEYRGYDSCGVAVYAHGLKRARSTARASTELMEQIGTSGLTGTTGIAHTRLGHPWCTSGAQRASTFQPWAWRESRRPTPVWRGVTHDGSPGRAGRIALVHNGIIENHDELRASLQSRGYVFQSQTDTEVIAHLIDSLYDGDLFEAVKAALGSLAWRLCDCGVLQGRAAPSGGSARRLATDSGGGAATARRITWPVTPWRWPV
jgi:glucosamine--fructose-6-phosphate aminotransferase (isomerizing)